MKLEYSELGSLQNISDALWNVMVKEIERNDRSDLTLVIEGSVRGLKEIIRLNNIED